MKIKYAVIGYGWRADFYYKIAKEIPEIFQITAGVLRTKERANQVQEKEHIFTTTDLEQAIKTNPDFFVLCVPRTIVKKYLEKLIDKNIFVLCETPPAQSVEELNELWNMAKEKHNLIQIAEQYFLQPYYATI